LSGKCPTVDDVPKLIYTKMVLSESMRLYPPVWAAARRPDHEDLELGKYTIPRDSTIFYSQFFVHRDERFFPNPDRFDPERFTPEEETKRPKFAYFPFAGGHRKCIGEGFAWQEGLLALAVIATRWRFRLVKGHPVALAPLTALKPKYGLRMVLEKREFRPASTLAAKMQSA
jgi:cytochrome P450